VYAVASLFSGAGGIDCGFEIYNRAKKKRVFKTVLAVDADEVACRTFKLNFPETDVQCTDIAEFSFEDFPPGTVDVLHAGIPCQDFSVLRGPRSPGISSRRGQLYLEFARALAVLKPRVFFVENVPGMARKNGPIDTILSAFRKPARDVSYDVVFSGVVELYRHGVPQYRKRLLIIGVRSGTARLSLKSAQQFARFLTAGKSSFARRPLTPMEAFEGMLLSEVTRKYRLLWNEYENILDEFKTKSEYRRAWFERTFKNYTLTDPIVDYARIHGIDDVGPRDTVFSGTDTAERLSTFGVLGWRFRPLRRAVFDDGSNDALKEGAAGARRVRMIPPGENWKFVRGSKFEINAMMSNIYRRLHPLVPSPTVIGRGGGGTWGYHYDRNRARLTNRERARLQSFPDWFEFTGTGAEVRAQVGNAVPPLTAARVARVLHFLLTRGSPEH